MQRGFSLIECMCALAIIGTALVASLSMYSAQESALATQRHEARARAYLMREFEWTNALPFEVLTSMDWTPIVSDGDFEVRRDVRSLSSNMCEVRVSVRWLSTSDASRTESLYTVRYENDAVDE